MLSTTFKPAAKTALRLLVLVILGFLPSLELSTLLCLKYIHFGLLLLPASSSEQGFKYIVWYPLLLATLVWSYILCLADSLERWGAVWVAQHVDLVVILAVLIIPIALSAFFLAITTFNDPEELGVWGRLFVRRRPAVRVDEEHLDVDHDGVLLISNWCGTRALQDGSLQLDSPKE
ncbi:hypothetical protein MKEN_00426600 [Mycena kentingensis (nom. inval.)]|nr:hypothetical protein MKEN_00426600 [Mycena kentingensis (nom. inval.)]